MRNISLLLLSLLFVLRCHPTKPATEPFTIYNPVNVGWLQAHLKQKYPRLILKADQLPRIRKQIQQDSLTAHYYRYLKGQADLLLDVPPLSRTMIGRRLLSVSREALRRLGVLSLVARVEDDARYVERIEQELRALNAFADWNPDHFLDVAEMAMGVAIAVDWNHDQLSQEVLQASRNALLEKAIQPGFREDWRWINGDNNWNQVCHGGLVAAALVLADEHPELSARVIQRAVSGNPRSLEVYGPDGGYPEGPGYWIYGTSYSCLMFSCMESGLGTDFGLSKAPGFLASADYRMLMATPSGRAYNYADNKTRGMGLPSSELLLWFAQKTANARYFDADVLRSNIPDSVDTAMDFSRLSAPAFLWLCQLDQRSLKAKGASADYGYWNGPNPVAVVRSPKGAKAGFYLGLKGGRASVNHGNADAGSFLLEWQGVSWSLDPGNQSYNELEEVMGNELWNRDQNSPRWTLLSKNNFGHSTLTVNDELHVIDGFAPISAFAVIGDSAHAAVDMRAVLEGQLRSASRTFDKHNDSTLTIRDQFVLSEETRTISWNLITQTEVDVVKNSVWLEQDGKRMQLQILSSPVPEIVVHPLSPPPLPYDIDLPGLKRLELRYKASDFPAGTGEIIIRMSGR